MAFNGSGTYTLPAGNPVVTGTTISSSTTNTTNSDIATALTNCITRDGQSTPSANLPMNAKKLTGLAAGTSAGDSVRYEQVVLTASLGTNVATFLATPSSANLAAALTDETGSGAAVFATSPTLVTPALGTPSSGDLSFCTNAVGYGLKSATTTVTVSGATAPTAGQVLTATSSTNATWQTVGSGALTLLSTVTASGASTVDIETTFNSTYDAYLLIGSGITQDVNNNSIWARMKIGGAYVTSAYRYGAFQVGSDISPNPADAGASQSATSLPVIDILGSAAECSADFTMWIYNPSSTAFCKYYLCDSITKHSASQIRMQSSVGSNDGTAALTGLRFYNKAVAGLISGKFRLYGISNS